MKHLFFSFIIILTMISCKTQDNNAFAGKVYKHTYLFSSMGNEYGKGGGEKYFKLIFAQKEVKLINMSDQTLPDENGVYNTKSDSTEIFTADYKVKEKSITIDNPIMPQLEIEEGQLTAPKINLQENQIKIPLEVLQNVVFELQQPTKDIAE